MMEIKEFYEIDETPEKGMVMCGFSAEFILEGKELKQQIVSLLKNGEIGFRQAVELFKAETMTNFNEAIRIVRMIKKDYMASKKIGNYTYRVNRVFWCYEDSIPKNDIRYCKLDVVDMRDINMEEYILDDKSIDMDKFIAKHANKTKDKPIIRTKVIAPEQDVDAIDKEWETK